MEARCNPGSGLQVDVLGPVRLLRRGVPVPLGGLRESTLVSLLTLRGRFGLAVDAIADELWEHSPPPGCRTTIRSYVTRLRRLFDDDDGASLLAAGNGVYRLDPDAYGCDVRDFAAIVKCSDRAVDAGERSEILGRALDLWRGPAYSEVSQTPLILAEAARLGEIRLIAVEDRGEADLALGRHRQLVPELQQLVADHPYRERLWRFLVLALYRSGRQPEALRSAQEHRRQLREHFGIEPSRRLTGLEHSILVRDPRLDWQPPRDRRNRGNRRSAAGPELSAAVALERGRDLLAACDFERAAALFATALAEVGTGSDVADREIACDLALGLGEARLGEGNLVGAKSAALAAADLARELVDAKRLAIAAWLASTRNVVGHPDEMIETLCRDALDALDALAPKLLQERARVLAGLSDYQSFALGESEGAIATATEALRVANESGDPGVIAQCLFQCGEALEGSPRLPERLVLADQLVAHAIVHGDVVGECDGLHLRALARLSHGDVAGHDDDRERLERLSAEHPDWHRRVFLRLWRGARSMMEGRLDEAEPELGALLDLGSRSREPNVQNLALGQLIFLRREQGRLSELLAVLEQQSRRESLVGTFRCAAALMHAEAGDINEGRRCLAGFVEGGAIRVQRDVTWTTSLCLLAETAVAVEDGRAARALLQALLPYRGQLAVLAKGIAVTGSFDRYIGALQALTGEDTAARASFEAALLLDSSLSAPPLAARTMAGFGHWLATQPGRKDRRRGESLLEDAGEIARTFGMGGLAGTIGGSAAPVR